MAKLTYQRLVEGTERGFNILVLLLLTGGPLPLLFPESEGSAPTAGGTSVFTFMWLAIYGFATLGILARWHRFVYLVTREKLLLALIGIAVLSTLWSAAPEVTLRSSIALVGTTLLGGYLTVRFSLSEQLHLLAWALGIAAVLSTLFALTMPTLGIWVDTSGEAWRGIYSHRNVLGRIMVLNAIACLLIVASGKFRWMALIGLVLSICLLILSNSKTAFLVLLAFLLLLPLFEALRWRYNLTVPILAAATLLVGSTAIWLSARIELVLSFLERDVTLSGRTWLWPLVLDMIQRRPWLGYGYNAFWRGWEGDSAALFLRLGYELPHAHNAILDLLLDLGVVGVLVFALGYVFACFRAVKLVRLSQTAAGLWPLVFLTFMLVYNVTESSILRQNNIFWVLYVSTALSTLVVRTELWNPTPQRRLKESTALVNLEPRARNIRTSRRQL
jgi:O-antigen ligase